jgi:superfamily II DNA or RNA helicase
MQKTTLEIYDEVNCRFRDLDASTRRKIVDALKFFVPYARHTHSFKLGRWDGTVSFATSGGASYINLLDRILPIVIEDGYEVVIDDRRTPHAFDWPEVSEDMLAGTVWPHGHPLAGEPIMLRDYQVGAIQRYLENPQSIQSISTGAGKTLLTATLSKICEAHGRSIVIVPSKSLVEQTEEDYRNLGLDVGVFFGDRKEWGKTHTICTWQSLAIFSKKGRREDAEVTIQQFIEGVVCVMVDETHTAKAKELQDLLTGPMAGIPIRWGLTGTVPQEDHEFLSLLASLGPVVGEIRAVDLQEQGVLANCEIEMLQLVDDHVEFKTYPEEIEYLTSDPTRLAFMADTCTEIAKSGNTLILVNRIETGEQLQSMIPGSIFVSGKTKTKDRKKEYKDVQFADGKIIIATYGVAAVGLNIPRIFNLVMVEAGKSFVRTIQSIGRVLRKAKDKSSANVYDFCSTAKFSAKHLTERKKHMKNANYKFKITKIRYR